MTKNAKTLGLDKLPNDWNIKLLPTIAEFRGGKAHESYMSDLGSKFICVNSKFISTNGLVRKHCSRNVSPARKGDVLLVMSDLPNGKALAKAFLVDKNDLYAVNQRICSLTPRGVHGKFLFYALNRSPYFLKFDDGVSQTHLLNPVFEKCPVYLPPTIVEQDAIAEALGDADALIGSLEQLIAKKRQIKQGAMQQLLTGKTRLPGFKRVWDKQLLGDVAPFRRGFDLPNANLKPGPYPVVYSNGILNHHYAAMVRGPGVVTGRSGTIGKVSYIAGDYWPHNTSLWVTDFNGNDPKFIFYLYSTMRFARFGSGTGVPTLNRSDLHSVKLSIPPCTAEQAQIAAILSDIDAELDALEAKLGKAARIKQGMMQVLLTGRVRLV